MAAAGDSAGLPCVAPLPPTVPSPWLPPIPPLEPTTAGIVQNDDLTLAAALPVNLTGLFAFVCCYVVLHFFFHPQFYTNPLKRGIGPEPPVNHRNAFAALYLCLRMSDDDFERYAGLDALALIEFIRLALKVLVGYAMYGLTAGLITVWAAATYGDDTWDGPPGGLARVSLANLRRFGSDLPSVTWDRWLGSIGSVIGAWYLTGLTLWLLGSAWGRILARRQRSLADARDASSLAILVRDTKSVPVLRKSMKKRDEAFRMWQSLYPGEIYDVRMVRDTGKLPALLAKHKKLSATVEKMEATLATLEAEDAASSKVEKALAKLRTARAGLLADIHQEYDTATAAENDRGTTYFVCFRKHRPCNLAKQVVNTDEHLEIMPAPLQADVRWASLRPSAAKLALPLKLASISAYYLMLSFYVLPITFVSGLLQLDQLSATFPFLEPILESLGEAVRSALSAFLPTLALIIFIALLPTLCTFIAGMQGYISLGRVDRDAFGRLFLFQFVWVFLGVTIGTSGLALINNLQEVARNPMSILDTLGSQLATSSIFFCVYLSIQFSYQLPKDLARIVPIAIHVATKSATAAAEGAQKAALESKKFAEIAAKRAAEQAANVGEAAAKAGAMVTEGRSRDVEDGDDERSGDGGVTVASDGHVVVRVLGSDATEQQQHYPPMGEAVSLVAIPPPPDSALASPDPDAPTAAVDAGRAATRDDEQKPRIAPEQFPYAVSWTKVMLASTLGLCYCSIQPIAILFACTYLAISYLLYKRGLLFSYTHASESRGAFWPAASARLLVILFFAQLMLTGVHSTKGAWPTALCIAATMPVTYISHRYFVRRYERQLDVLPLASSATADERMEEEELEERTQVIKRLSTVEGVSHERASQVALEAQEERKYNRLFAGFYVQPELLEAARLIKDKEAHRKFSVRDDAAIEDTAADLAVVSAAACGGIGTAAAM